MNVSIFVRFELLYVLAGNKFFVYRTNREMKYPQLCTLERASGWAHCVRWKLNFAVSQFSLSFSTPLLGRFLSILFLLRSSSQRVLSRSPLRWREPVNKPAVRIPPRRAAHIIIQTFTRNLVFFFFAYLVEPHGSITFSPSGSPRVCTSRMREKTWLSSQWIENNATSFGHGSFPHRHRKTCVCVYIVAFCEIWFSTFSNNYWNVKRQNKIEQR